MPDARFEPIAIVGRGCVLPGAFTPEALWSAVVAGDSLLSKAPRDAWGVTAREEAALGYRGGFVTGFAERIDPTRFNLGDLSADQLDPVFLWLLQAGHDAWDDAGAPTVSSDRIAVIAGNLCYPTRSLSDLAADVWLDGASPTHPVNRRNAGFPARVLARSLGATGPAFCLDAACASSLYALSLACDQLHDHSADIAVAGGVNAADALIVHQGFRTLNALSPTGRSRPLVEGADGLVPAEGAAAVALKRLSDVSAGEHVYGVIRGIGLSNDGNRRSPLAPDRRGQADAMRAAYAAAGLDPRRDVSLLECHATGTPTGDREELAATADVFGTGRDLPIGSLKSNTGHLITTAGLASLLKLMSAMKHETLPPTRLEGQPLPDCAEYGLKPQHAAEPWTPAGPRRAGLSNFGFGGANAHLILEEHGRDARRVHAVKKPARRPVVVCGVGVLAGPDRGLTAVARRLMRSNRDAAGPAETLRADPVSARTPPNDLARAQAQQLAVLDVIAQALDGVSTTAPERTGCFIGFSCAPEGARWALRDRIAARLGLDPDSPEANDARDRVTDALRPADVLGAMPNMSANRVSASRDWRGPSFSVCADEASGEVAFDLAVRALEAGELDLAIVAVADFATDAVNAYASDRPGPYGDAAAGVVLKAKTNTAARADPILADVTDAAAGFPATAALVTKVYGDAGVAAGLLELALSVCLGARGLQANADGITARTEDAYRASSARPVAPKHVSSPDPVRPAPEMAAYAAANRADLIAAVSAGRQATSGTCRLALVKRPGVPLSAQEDAAIAALNAQQRPCGPGVHFGEGEPEGALAFVYTGAAAAYSGAGRGLFSAVPDLARIVAERHRLAPELIAELAGGVDTPFTQLRATTLISQAQTIFLREFLDISPSVAMGLSSGETNSLIGFEVWEDSSGLLEDIAANAMYERDLGGAFNVARKAWGVSGDIAWKNWRILAPVDEVRAVVDVTPLTELTIIYSPADCVIGGDEAACNAVIERVGKNRAVQMLHELIVHGPTLAPYEDTWRALHTRETTPPQSTTFYANALNARYEPTSERIADVLTRQALTTVDFPATVEQAYSDGVRTFVEIGPRDTLTQSISTILGERDHMAVAADRFDRSDLEQIADAAAALFARGYHVNLDALRGLLRDASRHTWPSPAAPKHGVAHPAHIRVPRSDLEEHAKSCAPARLMPSPPKLTPVHYPPSSGSPMMTPSQGRAVTPPEPPTHSRRLKHHRPPTGPAFDRTALERAAAGRISDFFGPAFTRQDAYRRQVRLPRPPMLLTHRITGIDAQPGVLGTGTIWTETDVEAHSWALHAGFMRPGAIIEAGQADLALISYMGVDFLNHGERVYRLLGCELTFHDGGPPQPGEVLQFQISITGHARVGGVRMFFFEYDCRIGDRALLSVRSGQAGFFTDEELADAKGVLWDASTSSPPTQSPMLRRSSQPSAKRSFSKSDVDAFRAGDIVGCFGEGFERAAAQSRPALPPRGRLALFDDVEDFDPAGGPWGRGYLKARAIAPADAWFYDGHFHNDPCMPGTLMAEAAVQALEFYAAAIGMTVDNDGYVFKPAAGEAATFVCRGQVVPDRDHELTYEVFVDDIVDGDSPMVFAALLARCDGEKVFYCPRFGVRLRPAWPAPALKAPPLLVHPDGDVRGDHAALLECGGGAPSRAFGAMYRRFDTQGRTPRLPQPPYHMVSRIVSVSGAPGKPAAGITARAEYDVPEDAWYIEDNASGTMAISVLSEIVLQPCGWLASYCGFALAGDLKFRNLDGDGRVLREVRPGDGTIRTMATLTRFSRMGSTTIVFFDVEAVLADGRRVMTLSTSFGFFTPDALAQQAGLKTTDAHRAAHDRPPMQIPTPEHGPEPRSGRLAMIDAVDLFDPDGGDAGHGLIRGRQSVDPSAWYFKAHFFQDPVQPGSLGLDALVQLLERAVVLKGLSARFDRPRFEAVMADHDIRWSYRGQVTPDKRQVTTIVEITGVKTSSDATVIEAKGSLWADGLRIYEMPDFAIRLVEDGGGARAVRTTYSTVATPWVDDHRPTYTVPVLPLMALAGMAMRSSSAATNAARYPLSLTNFASSNWAAVPESGCAVETTAAADGAVAMRWRNGAVGERWRPLATGCVANRAEASDAPLLTEVEAPAEELDDLYASGELFHGPAFQTITHVRRGRDGFEAQLDLSKALIPGDPFDPIVLDGLVHCVPHERPEDWFDLPPGMVIYPVRILDLTLFKAPPYTGALTVRGRPARDHTTAEHLGVLVEASSEAGLFARLLLQEKAFPKGRLAALGPLERRSFIRGESCAMRAPLSVFGGSTTRLEPSAVAACDWLPGSVAAIYGAGSATGLDLVKTVVVKEHFARLWDTHPSQVHVEDVFASAPGRSRSRYAISFDTAKRAWAVVHEPAPDARRNESLEAPQPNLS